MGKANVSMLYKQMSPEDRSTFDRWLKANAIVGLILTVGIVAMAVAGSRSTDQRDVATASMTRASAVKRVAPVFWAMARYRLQRENVVSSIAGWSAAAHLAVWSRAVSPHHLKRRATSWEQQRLFWRSRVRWRCQELLHPHRPKPAD
jgi:hypothetical protein